MRALILSFAAVSLVGTAGCGGHVTLVAQVPSVELPSVARVEVKRIHAGIIEMEVFNTSPETIVIDRDGVELQTPAGMVERKSGGIGTTYNIPPGGVHGLNVKFEMRDMAAGTQVQLTFPRAVLVNAQPVQVPPIPLVVQ